IEEERRLCYVAMTRAEKYLYVTHAVERRGYGAELASEPSQFLNEMPQELIDDLSRGKSWLSFARGSKALEQAAGSLEYDYDEASEGGELQTEVYAPSGKLSARHPDKKYSGKTYDSVDSIDEFYRKRAARMGTSGVRGTGPALTRGSDTCRRPGQAVLAHPALQLVFHLRED